MLNSLNLQLQGQGKLICDMYSHIKAFEVKLALLLEQVKKHNFIHLPATQNLSAENPAVPFPAEKCVEALEMLKAEFGVRFRQLHVNAKEIRLFQNPFVADIDEAQPSYQFELSELQNCDVLKDVFKPNSLIDFYAALQNDTYPNIKTRNEDVHTFWQHVNGMDTVRVAMSVVKFVNPRTLRHQRWLREQAEAQTTGSEEPAKDNP
ncbi:hypothetical protein AAFF_G00429390 [Aldrovandia affinis]|uniref:Uncharacterized protein n=1 Tax=Aldrovandia affinis TaxID=143900 RepID=A0AAD7R3P8_9TELE|nr:hypothetical protein AAFF_G00429390 [Aldrovandia affinis]